MEPLVKVEEKVGEHFIRSDKQRGLFQGKRKMGPRINQKDDGSDQRTCNSLIRQIGMVQLGSQAELRDSPKRTIRKSESSIPKNTCVVMAVLFPVIPAS